MTAGDDTAPPADLAPGDEPCPGVGCKVRSACGYQRQICSVCEQDVGPWAWEWDRWPVAPSHVRAAVGPRAGDTAPADDERFAQHWQDSGGTSSPGFTLDDQGRRVADGWDHDGDLIAMFQGDLNRQRKAGDRLAEAAKQVRMVNGSPVGLDALADAVEDWEENR